MLANALSGLKVIDFTQVMAGPTCTLCMADLGADVVKIEAPAGDLLAGSSPGSGEREMLRLALNRQQAQCGARSPATQRTCRRRRRWSRRRTCWWKLSPGRHGALRLDLSLRCPGDNPRLIYCSVSAYGQQGASKDLPGVDGVLQAVSGLMSVTGARDGEPCKVPVPVVDLVTGSLATIAVLAALADRQRHRPRAARRSQACSPAPSRSST